MEEYIWCDHCAKDVSRSTYERHLRKSGTKQNIAKWRRATALEDSSSGSDTDCNKPNEDAIEVDINTEDASDTEVYVEAEESTGPQKESESSEEEVTREEYNRSSSSATDSPSSDEDNAEGEVWDGELQETLLRDISSTITPLPEPQPSRQTERLMMKKINALIFWLVYFLLVWQTACQISDNGMAWMLRFLVTWLKVIGIEISNDSFTKLVMALPGSMYMIRQVLGVDRDDFEKFVVCPKCTQLYPYDSCLKIVNNRQVGRTCTNYCYRRGKKHMCNSPLVKKVALSRGNECFYPIKYFCSKSIIEQLEKLLLRENFVDLCESWRTRTIKENIMCDVYDGKLWKEFSRVNGKDFLKCPFTYGFMLNFDYFQPIKHRKDYSVGVFYLALLNLPRSIRFKWENIIVIGIVPSMDKESKTLNEFLVPAIDELNALWKGVQMKSSLGPFPLRVRAALISTSSDVPAARKLCGFKGHAGRKGCSHCLKEFPGDFGERKDYSGFNRASWKKRTNDEHRRVSYQMKRTTTVTKRASIGKKFGISHFTALLELEYIDIVRFCTVDPMHNLFLGTAKKMFKIWTEENILSKKQLQEIEERIESVEVPSDIGRLPKRISCNSGSYTAEQWKNWTLIYSLVCLKGILPDEHFKCWQTFVLACRDIVQPEVSSVQLELADRRLLKFCTSVETLYGKEFISPNMHLHCHLKDIIMDHGPVMGFWCFSFERFNGILGSTTTNKRSVELQLMRKFTISRFLSEIKLPDDFQNDFRELSKKENSKNTPISIEIEEQLEFQSTATLTSLNNANWLNKSTVSLPSVYRASTLDEDDMRLLQHTYNVMFPNHNVKIEDMSQITSRYGSVTIGSVCYGSKLQPRGIRSSSIMASWPDGNGQICIDTFSLSPGSVQFYFKHSLKLTDHYYEFLFACVRWYKPYENSNEIGHPVMVWKAEHQLPGPAVYLPIQRIHSRFGQTAKNGKVIVCPIPRKVIV